MVVILDGTGEIAGKDVFYLARIFNNDSVKVPAELLVEHVKDSIKCLIEQKIEKSVWSYNSTIDGTPRYYVVLSRAVDYCVKVHVSMIVFQVNNYRSLKEVSESLHEWNDESMTVFNQWTNPELN